MKTQIAAHRGGAALWPENSLGAFRNALALGADAIELDVHLSSDGVPMVIHDPTLDRTTTGIGPIHRLLEAELSELHLLGKKKIPLAEGIPTLDTVLAIVAPTPCILYVELKLKGRRLRHDGLEEATVDVLRRHGMLARSTIMSFDREIAKSVATLTPDARAGLLIPRAMGPLDSQKRLRKLAETLPDDGIRFVGVHHARATKKTLEAMKECGLALGAWTVNGKRRLKKLFDLEVDVVITDRPDRALTVRTQLENPKKSRFKRSKK